MPSISSPLLRHAGLLAAALTAALAACGGGSGGGAAYMTPTATPSGVSTPVPPPVSSTFTLASLVADAGSGAAHVDSHLVNPWGIVFNPTGFVWVVNNGSASSTLYDGNGVPQTLVVATPPSSTGIVFNSSSDFKVSQAGLSGASAFIFSSENGVISGWSPGVDRNNAIRVFDGSAAQAVYKGLAIASFSGANYIYATDFHNGRVDVFDANFAKVALPGGFSDPNLPAGFAPFGIQTVGNRIYVSYAQRAASGDDEVHGAGAGVVDVFDTGGTLIMQLVRGGALNAPWGLAVAPADFGSFSGMLLVANFGDGKINAYDPATGAPAGTLSNADGSPVVIDGLWGIAFGPGVNSQPTNTLFFTAGPGGEAHGLYGRLDIH